MLNTPRRAIRFSAEVATLATTIGTPAAALGYCPLVPFLLIWLWFTLAWSAVAWFSKTTHPTGERKGEYLPAERR